MEWKKILKWLSMALTFVGSIAWGIYGITRLFGNGIGFNIVTALIGDGIFTSIVYTLVGVGAIYLLLKGKN